MGNDKLNEATSSTSHIGNDLLIGGATSYFTDTAANKLAREEILAAWSGPGTYAERINKLRAGVGPIKPHKLTSTTILKDNAVDTLLG